jgi:DNA-binding SARP family transcriptional activator
LEARAVLAAIVLERNDRSLLRDRLQAAFALLEKTRYVPTLSKYRSWAARLCGEALKLGIETCNVRNLVRQLSLRAPSIDLEAWPWPVRVYTLGRFRVLVDDRPLLFSHKTPKKPIALLKALIALGGRGVALDQIVDAVWPEEEGDSAHDACELALHRLRKLLGGPETVQLVDNRLSLNPELVWTDVAAFEQALSAEDVHTPEDNAVGCALSFYQGDFLAGETNAPWAAPARERLRGKFVHQVERQGQFLEEVERRDEAITFYLRGIDADPLAEAFYQGLMRCYQAQGKVAEALSMYRRLKQILSITLGITPSLVTETMARSLRASQ